MENIMKFFKNDYELENKIVRFTGDDNGTPCIDVLKLPEPGSWGYGKNNIYSLY